MNNLRITAINALITSLLIPFAAVAITVTAEQQNLGLLKIVTASTNNNLNEAS